jgi:hypothetical protein
MGLVAANSMSILRWLSAKRLLEPISLFNHALHSLHAHPELRHRSLVLIPLSNIAP